ncbi:MAG: N-acetylmuramoyl-L-alanine amidase [Candidatus Krumholzibacteriales bacterium]
MKGKRYLVTILLVAAVIAGGDVSASSSLKIKRIRSWTAPDHTRVVLDMSGESVYRVRELDNPHRIAIDIPGSRFSESVKQIAVGDGVIERIRINRLRSGSQVVFDLPERTDYRHFALKPNRGHPYRIVFDLEKSFSEREVKVRQNKIEAIVSSGKKVVIIDPGHGGSDPGACSRFGLQEKDVVLDICFMLKRYIEERPDYHAILTREGDYYVERGRRIQIAREHQGDCFVSVHANRYEDFSVRGSEVYFLSLTGASDENAQRVAERENVLQELEKESKYMNSDVQKILLDLTETDIMEKSSMLALCVNEEIYGSRYIPSRGVKQANFVVLRSISMPSILVEAAYLSNARDVRYLKNRNMLDWIARNIAEGVFRFFEKSPPPARKLAGAGYFSHTVSSGETLWSIAEKYGLDLSSLCRLNDFSRNTTIYPGQEIRVYREKN